MSNLTKEQAIEESFILWTELARSGGTKTEAAKAVGLDHVMDYVSSCPCCEYDEIKRLEPDSWSRYRVCECCPVWSVSKTCKHEYEKWQAATTFEEHREAAAKVLEPIAEAWICLPVKE